MMGKMNFKLLFGVYIVLHLVLALVVFNLEDKVSAEGIKLKFRVDYFAHMLAFMPWSVWGYWLKMNKIHWFIAGIIFAMTMEGLHYFVPYRVFNIIDLLSNMLGVLLGFGLLNLWLYSRFSRK